MQSLDRIEVGRGPGRYPRTAQRGRYAQRKRSENHARMKLGRNRDGHNSVYRGRNGAHNSVGNERQVESYGDPRAGADHAHQQRFAQKHGVDVSAFHTNRP